ncbi:ABC transporter substrate-binding protein [Pseudonocardia alni subsp. carboxydivorans]|uniref:ABC transporter substrate-binding protein n=1 Tax=Pseudonocardia alni subsp. carboxydivorans TaxID=415010 RepID=A0ABU9AJY1_PSEA5
MRRLLTAGLLACAVLAGCAAPAPTAAGPADTVRYVAPGSGGAAVDDPHGMLPAESDIVRMALTYDVLTVPGDDGSPQPRLATSWIPDPTLTRWTVRLRDNAVFTTGARVRAADALFSLRRMASKSAENFGRTAMFDLAASRATDDTTLTLVTRAPYAEVGTALMGATFVVPEGSTDFTSGLVPGSGPFRPVRSDAQTTVFERNDSWWGPRPPSRVIEVRALADPQARAQAVLSGEADLAGSVPPTAADQGAAAGLTVVRKPGATMYPLVMRTDTAPFSDPRVREAIRLGVDRRQLLDAVFGGKGRLGNDLITPTDPSSPRDLPQIERDVPRARALMAQAGLAGGVDVTLHTTTAYPGMDTAATLLSQQLAEIGVRARIEVGPPDTYFSTVYGTEPFYVSFLGGIPFLDVVRVALTPGSPTNETAWADPSWNAQLATALAEPDIAKRRAGLGALQTRLRDEGGYLVWGVGDRLDLAAPGVTGVSPAIGFGAGFLDRVHHDR